MHSDKTSNMGSIRLLLALSVVLAHTADKLPFVDGMLGGRAAVECFFILSGFYMALVLNEKYDKAAPFYWNRFSRIFSGYWVALAFSLLIGLISGQNMIAQILAAPISPSAKALLGFANVFLFGSDTTLFLDAAGNGLKFSASMSTVQFSIWQYFVIPPAWTLPIELCFYLAAPFVVRSIPRILALAAVSIGVRLWINATFGGQEPWDYRFMPIELIFFLGGALAYRLLPLARKSNPLIGWCLFAACVATIVLFGKFPSVGYLAWPMLPVYPLLAISTPFVLTAVRGRVDQEAGEVSYLLYLCHYPIIIFLHTLIGSPPAPLLVIVVALIISVGLQRISKQLDNYLRGNFVARWPPSTAPGEVSLNETR